MASRNALAIRVATAKDSIAKSMETISITLSVEIPEKPFSPRKNDPDVANALQLEHLQAFLENVASALWLVGDDKVSEPKAVDVETIPQPGDELPRVEPTEPVVLEPIPDPSPVVEESVVEPKHDKHSKHGKKGR